ncbi:DMT family transporter [uncultured Marinobacter sp.]|uniref:DMT family transporter n=1 Tax=uncultured Marinobacter sp. TaxID=187379 RepID=UPI00263000EA|nr:DMT family transporter [uncultured Marinobacter sp.]
MYYAFPLLAVIFWAGNTVVNKLAVGVIFPAEIGFYRWLFAAVILTPLLLRPTLRSWPVVKENLGKIFVLGVLGMAIYQSLAYFAAPKTSATNMGIVLALMPVMSLILAILALGHRLTVGAIVGSLFSFLGVLIVITSGDLTAIAQQGINAGDGMMLVAVAAYAIYSTLLKKWQIPLPAMQLLYAQVLVAVVVLFPLFAALPQTGLNSDNLPLVLFACVFASIGAPLAWMTGIKHLGPSRTSVFFNLIPILTALIASVMLSETLGSHHFIGGGLTLFGVLLSEWWTRPFRVKAQAPGSA